MPLRLMLPEIVAPSVPFFVTLPPSGEIRRDTCAVAEGDCAGGCKISREHTAIDAERADGVDVSIHIEGRRTHPR